MHREVRVDCRDAFPWEVSVRRFSEGNFKRFRQRPRKPPPPRRAGCTLVTVTGDSFRLRAIARPLNPCDMVQPQNLSYFAHGQPLVHHRDALPEKEWGGSHGELAVPRRSAPGLRPLAPVQCTPRK